MPKEVPVLSIADIRDKVRQAVDVYNSSAPSGKQLKRVELFGSYANGSANAASDVDLLVEFETPVVGLLALARALDALEGQFGPSVDMVKLPLPEESILAIERTIPLYEAA